MLINTQKTFLAIAIASILGSSGCATKVVSVKAPNRVPYQNKTVLTGSLACFGDMLASYKLADNSTDPLVIAIPSVKDATNTSTNMQGNNEIPVDMTDIALGIASSIGGALRVAHIPSTQELKDAVDASVIKQNYFGSKFRVNHYDNNGIILYGALTEYDKVRENIKSTVNLGAEFGGGQGSTTLNASSVAVKIVARIAMDFRVVAPQTGIFNHASSTNTLDLFQIGKDGTFGVSVNGQSIGYSGSFTEVEARYIAIRTLIELGLMESIGKYEMIPYWKCLPNIPDNSKRNIKVSDLLGEPILNPKQNEEKTEDQDQQSELDKHQRAYIDTEVVNAAKMEFEYVETHNNNLVNNNKRLFLVKDPLIIHRARPEQTLCKVWYIINKVWYIIKEKNGKAYTREIDSPDCSRNQVEHCDLLTSSILGEPIPNDAECTQGDFRTISGKNTKIANLTRLYGKNYNQIMSEFKTLGIVSNSDDKTNNYLAIRFNAPVIQGTRWHFHSPWGN